MSLESVQAQIESLKYTIKMLQEKERELKQKMDDIEKEINQVIDHKANVFKVIDNLKYSIGESK